MTALDIPFGPYRLVRRIGRGGMAETFVARRRGALDTEQVVCLKRILPGLVDDPDLARMFDDEVRLSAMLHHANVAQVVDFGDVDGVRYLALELVDGVDLRALVRAEPSRGLPWDVVGEVALAVAHALAFAHAVGHDGLVRGMVHRDVSPSNVLLSTSGEVKLTDFGIAKAAGESQRTQTGVIKGKIPYMAPEYATEGRFDARSDLFSLGVMLYECATGVRPFDGANHAETLQRISEGAYVPLATREVDAPRSFVDAVDRMLARDPALRFPHGIAFLEAWDAEAPTASARLRVAARVRRVRGDDPPTTSDPALADTTYVATLGTAPAAPSTVVSSAPDAATRTNVVRDDSGW